MNQSKKEKLKELYLSLATPEEKDAILKMDDLRSIKEEVKKGNKVIEQVEEVKNKVSKLKNADYTDLLEAIKEMSGKIGMIKLQERVDKESPMAYKLMLEQLSGINEKVGGWKYPQYAYTGLRNKSFSPINPKTDGIGIGSYDYVALVQDTLTDTYTFYQGGASGNLVATIVIVYTNSGKGTISTVTKTPIV